MNAAGIARTETQIIDLSLLVSTGIKGLHAVHGPTEWGEVGKSVVVGSWESYQREFGGLIEDDDFPLICRRALEAGARLRVARAAHYTDPADAGTIEGVKATGDLGDEINSITFEAFSIGAWGNKVTVSAVSAANGATDELDITVEIAGYPHLAWQYSNLPIAPTQAQIDAFNIRSKYAKITTVTGTGAAADDTVTLTTGEQDVTSIVAADIIGDSPAGTGIFVFNEDTDMTKIAVPSWADPTVDIALAQYADSREDLIALVRTPIGLTGSGVVDYREGEGAYDHEAIDTWRAFMYTGGLRIRHPETGQIKEITALGDIMGNMSRSDNKAYEWFSSSGPKRGKINNALGVVKNFGSPAYKAQADLIDIRGINMVIDHPDFGPVGWGNSSLQKADTLLKHANVAELMIFIVRGLKPLVQTELFDPNDVDTWKAIFRRVTPFMEYIKNNRGIWDYIYQGDQDIEDVEEAEVNESQNIGAGQYIFRLFIKPKVGLKYIGIQAVVTNSGANFELIQETL